MAASIADLQNDVGAVSAAKTAYDTAVINNTNAATAAASSAAALTSASAALDAAIAKLVADANTLTV